jgi:YMGG-like Gly-zipper
MNIWNRTLMIGLAGMTVLVSGCVNPDGSPNNTGTGALVGTALGALTGAAIGGPGHGGQDALIGAGVGALAGGLIGNSADREQYAQQDARLQAEAAPAYAPAPVEQPAPMTMADVKALAKAGISEDVMISQIKNSHTIFHLNANDIIDLRNAGVPDKVVNFMINTASSLEVTTAPPAADVTYLQPPPPPPVDAVVLAPGPAYVWIGGEWVWNGGWYWVGGHWEFPPHPHAVWVAGHTWQDAYGWHNQPGHWL